MAKDSTPPPSLPRRRFGNHIREARNAANLRQPDVAKAMRWSVPTQSRIERGYLGTLNDRDVRDLCEVLGIDDKNEVAALIALLEEATAQPKKWWQQHTEVMQERFDVYVGLESEARSIDIYRSELVPGLFQTADYAKALNQLFFPHDSEEQQARRIELKLQRQASLTRKTKPLKVNLVLDEAILHRVVGNRRIMRAQAAHLADMSTRENISIRILPFTAGYPAGTATGAFSILSFEADPPVVYVESFTSNLYFEEDAEVAIYNSASTTLHRSALDAQASRSLLRQMVKEYSG
ncbi:helix-turn-helix domain-containing protein [Nocardia amamiensis]|uniref:Helix-turn-helix domain-containing protein n=1 Tax=Nocardia amamiensis TaxID=404578 RepID=A0ABS0CWG0_9NOCA|nr:helix-turn-helix transcriptional regulator [Nocardia amamiensis]MBF6300936.1 helix-turn-helix domain-containing protein [Nocardia amamiensis]